MIINRGEKSEERIKAAGVAEIKVIKSENSHTVLIVSIIVVLIVGYLLVTVAGKPAAPLGRNCVHSTDGLPPTCSDDVLDVTKTPVTRGGDGTCKATNLDGKTFSTRCLYITAINECAPC